MLYLWYEPVFASRDACAAFMRSAIPILFGTMFNYDMGSREKALTCLGKYLLEAAQAARKIL